MFKFTGNTENTPPPFTFEANPARDDALNTYLAMALALGDMQYELFPGMIDSMDFDRSDPLALMNALLFWRDGLERVMEQDSTPRKLKNDLKVVYATLSRLRADLFDVLHFMKMTEDHIDAIHVSPTHLLNQIQRLMESGEIIDEAPPSDLPTDFGEIADAAPPSDLPADFGEVADAAPPIDLPMEPEPTQGRTSRRRARLVPLSPEEALREEQELMARLAAIEVEPIVDRPENPGPAISMTLPELRNRVEEMIVEHQAPQPGILPPAVMGMTMHELKNYTEVMHARAKGFAKTARRAIAGARAAKFAMCIFSKRSFTPSQACVETCKTASQFAKQTVTLANEAYNQYLDLDNFIQATRSARRLLPVQINPIIINDQGQWGLLFTWGLGTDPSTVWFNRYGTEATFNMQAGDQVIEGPDGTWGVWFVTPDGTRFIRWYDSAGSLIVD
jgi:hypothetical protein